MPARKTALDEQQYQQQLAKRREQNRLAQQRFRQKKREQEMEMEQDDDRLSQPPQQPQQQGMMQQQQMQVQVPMQVFDPLALSNWSQVHNSLAATLDLSRLLAPTSTQSIAPAVTGVAAAAEEGMDVIGSQEVLHQHSSESSFASSSSSRSSYTFSESSSSSTSPESATSQCSATSSSSSSSSPSQSRKSEGTSRKSFYSTLAAQLGETDVSMSDHEDSEDESERLSLVGGSSRRDSSGSWLIQTHPFATAASPSSPRFDWRERMFLPNMGFMKIYFEAAKRIGLPFDLADDDYVAAFLVGDEAHYKPIKDYDEVHAMRPSDSGLVRRKLDWSRLPDNYRPQGLASVVPHHFYLDLAIPWASMRSKLFLLCHLKALVMEEFCVAMWPDSSQRAAYDPPWTVHGDDMFDEEAYEVSETFLTRWPFFFDRRIVRRTNWWRRQRGLKNLEWDPKLELKVPVLQKLEEMDLHFERIERIVHWAKANVAQHSMACPVR